MEKSKFEVLSEKLLSEIKPVFKLFRLENEINGYIKFHPKSLTQDVIMFTYSSSSSDHMELQNSLTPLIKKTAKAAGYLDGELCFPEDDVKPD